MRSPNFLGTNVVCIEAADLSPKQVLCMVFSSHISMLNGWLIMACSAMTFLDSVEETLTSF